jgi:hypothetical protein
MKNPLFVIPFLLFLLLFVVIDIRGLRADPQDRSEKVALYTHGLTATLLVLWLFNVKVGMPTRPFIDPIGMTLYQWIKEMIG